MVLTRYILIVWLSAVLPATGFTQSSQYRLETFGTRDGLLSSKVYALAQSSDRMLWIGTELGVSVYNGYSFTNYQYTSGNESIGRILCLTQDKLNGMWLGGDKGLFYFKGDSIIKVELQNKTLLAVETLLTDATGNVWAGDLNALYKITATQVENLNKNNLTTLPLSPFASFNERVFSLATDNRQNIYWGSYDGVFKIPADKNTYEQIWTNPNPLLPVRSVAAISPDSIFWNCLDGHPMQLINGKTGSHFTEDFLGRTVFTNRQRPFALTTNGVGRIQEGIVHSIITFDNITNNAVTALIDAEENIWVGSWEGLQKFRKNPFRQYPLPQTDQKETYSFLELKNGELLFGSNRGIVFTRKQDSIVTNKTMPALFPLAEVMCMYEDAEGGLWAGSGYQGISRFKNKKLTNWSNTGFLKDNNCEALYPAADGKLYACTENGVTLIDPMAEEPMTAHYPFQKKFTRRPELFGCFQTGSSGYWFYGSQGLYSLRNGNLVDDSIINMPVKSLYINKIISDTKGNIWVATQGKGLLQCRYQGEKLVLQKQYNSHNGLPSDNALSVLADKNDNIWWGDYMSFSVLINPGADEQLITYNEKDGLLSSYYQTLKLEQQKNGTIWGLTSMGLVSFHPDSISRNDLPPVLLINTIAVSGSTGNFFNIKSPVLSYDHNSIQFHYTAICLTDPSKIRYAYRLKELDSNWVYTNNRNVDFNFLQAGTYTFELKACNNNNVWTSQPLQYVFTIRPPFWQTWWFGVILLSMITAVIFSIFKLRMRSFKTKAAIRQQMAELEAKAIRAQMNPHFIFNSLNAIQELIITENYTAAYQYLSKFSKLLRLVLNNSEKNLIPLRNEIEMNQLYLELESLRFKQSFHYTIRVDEKIDADTVLFPSLLLQPFIENAIWHGLMHKEGDKKLAVSFIEENNRLRCFVEDNGVGRIKAAEIKARKLGAHHFDSKGTQLALQRIEALQQTGFTGAEIKTEDIFDGEGNNSGTKVEINIPLPKKTTTP